MQSIGQQMIAKVHLEMRRKKTGLKEPGLRHWPQEADTITFQEG
jgi:hypothetical protein